MSNIGEYRSVMFNEIETVELVDKTDPEYTQWKKKIYSKTTPAQKRREKEIKDHQDFFKKFKEIWLSNEYENIKVKNYCFKNCAKFIPRKTYYSKEEYVIDMLKESCRSGKIPTAFFNDFYKDFFQNVLNKISFRGYLYDLGLEYGWGKPSIGKKAKQHEYLFKEKIKSMKELIIRNKVFKIYQKDHKKNFKIPDVIFEKDGKFSIIEYKIEQQYGNFQQLLDYGELFKLATIEPLENLYWVIHEIDSIYNWFTKFKEKAPEKIQVYTEEEFEEKYNPKQKLGIDAWM